MPSLKICCSAVLFAAFIVGCGNSDPDDPKPESPKAEQNIDNPPEEKSPDKAETPEPKSTAETPTVEEAKPFDPEAQLRADIDEAVALIKSDDLETLINNFMPVERLRELRQETTVANAIGFMKRDPKSLKTLQAFFEGSQGGVIQFINQEKTLAVITPKPGAAPDLSSPFQVANPEEEKIPVEGYEGSWQEAVAAAIGSLEADQIDEFVGKFFPNSQVGSARQADSQSALANRLKEFPQMKAAMLADLKSLQKLEPSLNEQETIAEFVLDAGTPTARTVQLVKQGTWKLADTAAKMRQTLYQESQNDLKLFESETKFHWELVRDHWRVSDFD